MHKTDTFTAVFQVGSQLRLCTRAQSVVIRWFTTYIQIKVHNAASSVPTYTLVVHNVALY